MFVEGNVACAFRDDRREWMEKRKADSIGDVDEDACEGGDII